MWVMEDVYLLLLLILLLLFLLLSSSKIDTYGIVLKKKKKRKKTPLENQITYLATLATVGLLLQSPPIHLPYLHIDLPSPL